MDIKEAEQVVIAKPIASRPTCSSFKSFSEILACAFNTSPPKTFFEATVPAIRPKIVRFKPKDNPAPPRAKVSATADCSLSDKVSISDSKSSVLFKPLAKYVSKRAISQLSTVGNLSIQNQVPFPPVEAHIQCPNQDKDIVRFQLNSNLPREITTTIENSQSIESSRVTLDYTKEDPTSLPPQISCVQPSYDGYNWRKYGQKQVKGSEHPRSYYKCTHPNCPVKKKVERSLDGQIAEIVYKGEHSHSKPRPLKHNSTGIQGEGSLTNGTTQDTNCQLWFNFLNEQAEGCEGKLKNQNEVICRGKVTQPFDCVATGEVNAGCGISNNSCGPSVEFEERNKGLEPVDDRLRSKKRGGKNQINEAGASVDGVHEPHVMVQSSTDTGTLGKGFRWRKYGQKVVKGNLYPRSYYRCTGLKCKARKYVERASDDPKAFITTYEGKHNHDISLGNANLVTSETE